jgi:hypothetical protein
MYTSEAFYITTESLFFLNLWDLAINNENSPAQTIISYQLGHCTMGLPWYSRQSKHLLPLRSYRFGSRYGLKWTHVSQRSAESRGFSPAAPVSSHRES